MHIVESIALTVPRLVILVSIADEQGELFELSLI